MTDTPGTWENDFIEQAAAIEHARWSKWQLYMFSQCTRNPDGSLTIPPELVHRWTRQAATGYEQLTETEKESDREQTRPYLPLVRGLVEK